jgi:hypothetical protein
MAAATPTPFLSHGHSPTLSLFLFLQSGWDLATSRHWAIPTLPCMTLPKT